MDETRHPDAQARDAIRNVDSEFGGAWNVQYDRFGMPLAVCRGNWTILHLEPSQRTCACAEPLVAYLKHLEDWKAHNP